VILIKEGVMGVSGLSLAFELGTDVADVKPLIESSFCFSIFLELTTLTFGGDTVSSIITSGASNFLALDFLIEDFLIEFFFFYFSVFH